MMKANIAMWSACGWVGSFGGVSLPDYLLVFNLALLLSLYKFLFNYFYLYVCVCVYLLVRIVTSLLFPGIRGSVIRLTAPPPSLLKAVILFFIYYMKHTVFVRVCFALVPFLHIEEFLLFIVTSLCHGHVSADKFLCDWSLGDESAHVTWLFWGRSVLGKWICSWTFSGHLWEGTKQTLCKGCQEFTTGSVLWWVVTVEEV